MDRPGAEIGWKQEPMNELVGVAYLTGLALLTRPWAGFEAELRPKDRLGGGPRGGALLDSGLVQHSWVLREFRTARGGDSVD